MSNSPLNKFITEIKRRDIARANRYAVTIIPPKLMGNIESDTVMLTNMMCEAASLPGVTFDTERAYTFGETREIPVVRDYRTIDLSFYLDKNLVVKQFFDRWIASIIDQKTRRLSYYDDIISTISISTVNVVERGTHNDKFEPYTVTLFEAYPKNLHDIQVSYISTDVMKLTVEIQYKYWTTNKSEKYADNYKTPVSSGGTDNPPGQTTAVTANTNGQNNNRSAGPAGQTTILEDGSGQTTILR